VREFAGKVAVVTGAGSGMGRAFAERFAAEGMKVVLADVEVEALEAAVAELRDQGRAALGVQTDVSKREEVEELARASLDAYGKVHLVCNNAGVEGYMDGPIWEATEKDWKWTMGVNFWGVVHGVQTFLAIMLEQGEDGHMVNTASATSIVAGRNMYSVAKHAVLALTETVHAQLRERDARVHVTALIPTLVATRIFQGSRNRPQELQNEVEPPGAVQGREHRRMMHERLAASTPPSVIADLLVEAIREERLYLVNDHTWDERARTRMEDILAGRNPNLALPRV
jgi:NAD(P)-dependent dehydrogenase (short-subunit alcohol dehydrogenase family)